MSKKKSQRDHEVMEQRRLRAVRLFEKDMGPSEVARRLGVRRQSAHQWRVAWLAGGRQALHSKGKAGRKPRLTAAQRQEIVQALLDGPESSGFATAVWTLPRVAAMIEVRTGERFHRGHVWHLLRALGFSCQRPTRRAIERDEKAIAHWKRYRWPQLKKKRVAKGD